MSDRPIAPRYRGIAPLALALMAPALIPQVAQAQVGWYKGDLHAHSLHSDGDSPVADIIAVAEARGLDFFALTDHDSSMGGETPHWFDPAYRSDVVTLLYGVEWTDGGGHANVWAAEPFDYRPLWAANLAGDPGAAAEAAHAQGALFSINHPTNYLCCPWDLPAEGMDGVEVWNGAHRIPTVDVAATRSFWGGLLEEGRRPTAVGGSDMHDLKLPLGPLYTVGDPTTWVYAGGPSAPEILEAIASGRASISYGPQGPRAELWADGDRDGRYEVATGEGVSAGRVALEVTLGTDAATRAQGMVEWDVEAARGFVDGELTAGELARWRRELQGAACGPGYMVALYNGSRLSRIARADCGGGRWELVVDASPGDALRVEVMGIPDVNPVQHPLFGLFIAMTNPIYVE